MDNDAEVLTRVGRVPDFFLAVFQSDTLEDWSLARDLGKLLLCIDGEEIIGHALLARVYRHLGNTELALAEFERCRNGVAKLSEKQFLHSFFLEEEKLLFSKNG